MIKDLITGHQYNGSKCRLCGSENIYIIHIANHRAPDDISKDKVYCRCDDCRNCRTLNDGPYRTDVKDALWDWERCNNPKKGKQNEIFT